MADPAPPKKRTVRKRLRRRLARAAWFRPFEDGIARRLPSHPLVLSGLGLVVVTPLILLSLAPISVLPSVPGVTLAFFLLFAGLDYLADLAARRRGQMDHWELVLDQASDFPLVLGLVYLSRTLIPAPLLGAKVGTELLLILLAMAGRGGRRKRLRTAMSYTTLLALLLLGQGWAAKLVSAELVTYLLYVNLALSTIVILHQLGVLQKRMLADALSGANLLCGIFSIMFAIRGRVDMCLVFLMLGAAFDGFDGAAARRFGSTPWGMYSDDVADAVNHGIAPGVALYFLLQGAEGLVLGLFYTVFTLGRLAYFTLNQAYADPGFFAGVPSPAAALATLCAANLFPEQPALIGLTVGIAGIWMISFDTQYRHLGRYLGSNRRALFGMPAFLLLLLIGFFLWGKEVPVAIIFGTIMIYGFAPVAVNFSRVLKRRRQGGEEVPCGEAG